jgi:hypothetical protein
MPQGKTAEEIAADEEAASREQREQLAREANKKRNDAMLEARNAIADRADEVKVEEDEIEPLTDEVWDQTDREEGRAPKTRKERLAEQDAEEEEQEADELAMKGMTEEEREAYMAAKLLRAEEQLDEDQDLARDHGASDSRKNADGAVEYKVKVNGHVVWLTLSQLREQAGDGSDDSDTRQRGGEGDTTPRTRAPSPDTEAIRKQAEERRQQERAALRTKLRDLNLRASMGDEAAIDELTDLQLDAISGDSDRMLAKVDERVDARIVGRTDFQKAVDWFESEAGYADVLTTPRLKQEAGRLDAELARQNPTMTPRERLEQVGKQMRQLREDLGGAPRKEPPPRRESKLERKANAPQVPRAAGRTRSEPEPDETETTQQAIQRLAQSRGQHRAISHKH